MIVRAARFARRHARRLGPAAWLRWLRERTSPFRCPVCEARVDVFEPLYENLELLTRAGYDVARRRFQTLHWNAYACPRCGATDRDRLVALYLASRAPEDRPAGALLDIAPSEPLSAHLRARYPQLRYRTADLRARGVDDHVDMQSMALYGDGHFDCVLCSHVLEHVADDRKALAELHRILKPGGWSLVLVPIDLSLREVLEQAAPLDETGRWRLFGQGDHVRMYSHEGFVARLREAGFDVEVLTAARLGARELYRAGIDLASALFVARRPAGGRAL